ncbi:MAG: methyltransferase, partial [Methanotrichaceae archaeon]
MDCSCCGRKIRPAEEVLAGLDALYMACPLCPPEPELEKNSPLHLLDRDLKRCSACGRAPLDLVMLEVLEVLVDFGLRDRSDTLRSVGSPLVEIGYPMAYPPRLGRDELIISGRGLSRPAAEEITKSVPEVKGVIQGDGLPGMIDPGRGENDPELLAGCDLRCDVVQSIFGDLVIYKNQSKVHIEFSRQDAPKMRILDDLCLRRRVRDVADCLCGPGTLGLICLLAGATRVVLNDIWRPAVENAILNLEVNRSALGIGRVDRPEPFVSD